MGLNIDELRSSARQAVTGLLAQTKLEEGDLFIVGCSTSEVAGQRIGTAGSGEIAAALYEGIAPTLAEIGVWLAVQCCEHLNRAILLEDRARREYGLPAVNAVPQPKAGGAFATYAWNAMEQPVLVEAAQAAAGLDIGDTLIGMHLRPVAIPVRLTISNIGAANLVAARTRPKFIGGVRAAYSDKLL